MKTLWTIFLTLTGFGLAVLAMGGVAAHAQVTCPAHWNSFPFLYGTIGIDGSGTYNDSGLSLETTNQHISVGVKLAGSGNCVWGQAVPPDR